MGYKNKAYVIDENLVLSKAQTLPNADDADSAVVNYGGNSLGYMKIVVKAHTEIVIPAEGTFTIVASYGNTSSPTDTLGKVLYEATAPEDDDITIPAGETICEEIISDSLLDNYKYMKLTYTTDADLSDYSVDAFVVMA